MISQFVFLSTTLIETRSGFVWVIPFSLGNSWNSSAVVKVLLLGMKLPRLTFYIRPFHLPALVQMRQRIINIRCNNNNRNHESSLLDFLWIIHTNCIFCLSIPFSCNGFVCDSTEFCFVWHSSSPLKYFCSPSTNLERLFDFLFLWNLLHDSGLVLYVFVMSLTKGKIRYANDVWNRAHGRDKTRVINNEQDVKFLAPSQRIEDWKSFSLHATLSS